MALKILPAASQAIDRAWRVIRCGLLGWSLVLYGLVLGTMPAVPARPAEPSGFQFEMQPPREKMWDSRYEALREEGLRLPAHRTSQEDGEGNWGYPNAGWQLSVRPVRSTFTQGEPVYLWAVVRNVSGTNSQYMSSIPERNWEFTVTTDAGQVLEPKYAWAYKPEAQQDKATWAIRASREIIVGGAQYEVRANHQGLHLLRLSEDYDFKRPGTYKVTLIRKFHEFGRSDFSQVTSGTASFQVTDGTNNASKTSQNLTHSPPTFGTNEGSLNGNPSAAVASNVPGATQIADPGLDQRTGSKLSTRSRYIGLGLLVTGAVLLLVLMRRKT